MPSVALFLSEPNANCSLWLAAAPAFSYHRTGMELPGQFSLVKRGGNGTHMGKQPSSARTSPFGLPSYLPRLRCLQMSSLILVRTLPTKHGTLSKYRALFRASFFVLQPPSLTCVHLHLMLDTRYGNLLSRSFSLGHLPQPLSEANFLPFTSHDRTL
jgi:hypothetical protein